MITLLIKAINAINQTCSIKQITRDIVTKIILHFILTPKLITDFGY